MYSLLALLIREFDSTSYGLVFSISFLNTVFSAVRTKPQITTNNRL